MPNCNCNFIYTTCGHVNTENPGNIPRMGPCSYPNINGFYKKMAPNTNNYMKITDTYLGDISPMFGIKTAFDNLFNYK